MTSNLDPEHIRSLYLRFFERRGHARIASAPLVPDGDPSVLFTSAGMHPLVPYLLGQPHPSGSRLVGYQACLRTNDIEEVGDATHLTCFEMLGNWSLGDYGKEDSIRWSYEFLTGSEWLGISPERLWVTVFAGDDEVPPDADATRIWQQTGLPSSRVIPLSSEHNWWATGTEGPCGPDTEIFFDRFGKSCDRGSDCLPSVCDCGRFVEVWNNVFMAYDRRGGKLERLARANIDTGMGLERIASVLGGHDSVFGVPGLREPMQALAAAGSSHELSLRIATDHLRAAVLVLGDARAIEPDKQGAGYVLRRLIRRALLHCSKLGVPTQRWIDTADVVIQSTRTAYPELLRRRDAVVESLQLESERFERVRSKGESLLQREVDSAVRDGCTVLPGNVAFRLFDTYGFPVEFTRDLAREQGLEVDEDGFRRHYAEHQKRSRSQRAISGLADDSGESVLLHTATHLLHAALRAELGSHVEQRGSNITRERLRFDFCHPAPLCDEELQRIEARVQQAIDADLPVVRSVCSVEDAKAQGAVGLFSDRYEASVSLYAVPGHSIEICAGPHAGRTGELGRFRIVKEGSCGAGLRRIRAVLER